MFAEVNKAWTSDQAAMSVVGHLTYIFGDKCVYGMAVVVTDDGL